MKTEKRDKERDLNLFIDAFIDASDLIGLHAWNFSFHHRSLSRAYAQVIRQGDVRFAEVRLALNRDMNDHDIISSAVHEAIHVLLTDISDMASAMFSDTVVTQQEEMIVNCIEKALTPVVKERIGHGA